MNELTENTVLETPRLILRELTDADFDDLYAVLADSDIMQHYPYTFDEARVRNWIKRNQERYAIFGFGLWAVILKESGQMIGDCGISMQNIHGSIRPEIGYHIRAIFQKQGFATEAARCCRDFIFRKTCFNTVYSYMQFTNAASQRVAVKNGMQFLETFTDSENARTAVYGITRSEWKLKSVFSDNHVIPEAGFRAT